MYLLSIVYFKFYIPVISSNPCSCGVERFIKVTRSALQKPSSVTGTWLLYRELHCCCSSPSIPRSKFGILLSFKFLAFVRLFSNLSKINCSRKSCHLACQYLVLILKELHYLCYLEMFHQFVFGGTLTAI